MTAATHKNLWQLTSGQRLRYVSAILSMALTNLFMFGAPLLGKDAIDVVLEQDFSYATPGLRELAHWLGGPTPYLAYLGLTAVLAVAITAIGGIFLYFRGRLAAIASESILRRLREALYQRLHHLPAAFYDSADTGDLVQRCSSDAETLRVFLSSDIVEIGLIKLTPDGERSRFRLTELDSRWQNACPRNKKPLWRMRRDVRAEGHFFPPSRGDRI